MSWGGREEQRTCDHLLEERFVIEELGELLRVVLAAEREEPGAAAPCADECLHLVSSLRDFSS